MHQNMFHKTILKKGTLFLFIVTMVFLVILTVQQIVTADSAALATSGDSPLIENINLVSDPRPLDYYAGATIILINPATAANEGWGFVTETATGSGDFVIGPGIPPVGNGSAQLVVDDTGGELIGTQTFAGLRFDNITRLNYSTYQQASGNPNYVPTLQLNVDYDLTDANTSWQGRLIFDPIPTGATVYSQTWQSWNALNGAGWWASGAPGSAECTLGAPCTWAEVLTAFPNAGVQSGALSGVLLKAGAGWTGGFTGNVDALIIGVNAADTIYNFEPNKGYLPIIAKK